MIEEKKQHKTGDIVTIKNKNMLGNVFDEGRAKLKKPLNRDQYPELWYVEFEDEPGIHFPRFIY